jgi:Tfp pilus assembly protein PilX
MKGVLTRLKTARNEEGASLASVVLISSFVFITIFGIASTSLISTELTANNRSEFLSSAAAEAGVDDAIALATKGVGCVPAKTNAAAGYTYKLFRSSATTAPTSIAGLTAGCPVTGDKYSVVQSIGTAAGGASTEVVSSYKWMSPIDTTPSKIYGKSATNQSAPNLLPKPPLQPGLEADRDPDPNWKAFNWPEYGFNTSAWTADGWAIVDVPYCDYLSTKVNTLTGRTYGDEMRTQLAGLTAPTVLDFRDCRDPNGTFNYNSVVRMDMINRYSPQPPTPPLVLKTDVTFLMNHLEAPWVKINASDGKAHQVNFIIPDETPADKIPTCPTTRASMNMNGAIIDPLLSVFAYSSCAFIFDDYCKGDTTNGVCELEASAAANYKINGQLWAQRASNYTAQFDYRTTNSIPGFDEVVVDSGTATGNGGFQSSATTRKTPIQEFRIEK